VRDKNQQISIPFKIIISLKADLHDSKVKIYHGDSIGSLEGTQEIDLELNLCFNSDDKEIKLLEVSGFGADPQPSIKIEKLLINGYQVKYFEDLLSFDMKDNQYVKNQRISGTELIDFNGVLYLDTEMNNDRMRWFPMTYSKERSEIIYKNSILNCQSPYGCFGGLDCTHDPLWQTFELDHGDHDIVALGCSFTAGTGIMKEKSWPSLLAGVGKGSVLNLGVPGAGCDSVLVNLKNILDKKIDFKKIIILLPDMGRRLLRFKKNGLYFNFVLVPSMKFDDEPHFNIFFDKDEHQEIIKKAHRKMILTNPTRRDTRIIHRIVSCLQAAGVDFFISSWSDEVYETLKSCTNKKNLLPKFNEDNDRSLGIDGSHPAEHIHEKWVRSIEKQIRLGR